MFSIFTQTAQTSVSEPQQQPADQGRSGSGIGYSSCVVA
nr:a3.2 [Pseudozyma thailandica]